MPKADLLGANRLALSHVLLLEGSDWQATAKALRDVLAFDPNHAEARKNLAILQTRGLVPR
jgi:hypothetical protein